MSTLLLVSASITKTRHSNVNLKSWNHKSFKLLNCNCDSIQKKKVNIKVNILFIYHFHIFHNAASAQVYKFQDRIKTLHILLLRLFRNITGGCLSTCYVEKRKYDLMRNPTYLTKPQKKKEAILICIFCSFMTYQVWYFSNLLYWLNVKWCQENLLSKRIVFILLRK